MSDSLCGLLKIELTERHLPARPDNPVVALPPFSMKVRAPPQVQRNQMPPTRQTNSYSALAKVCVGLVMCWCYASSIMSYTLFMFMWCCLQSSTSLCLNYFDRCVI